MCDANPRASARLNGCSGGSSQGNGDVEDGDDTEALAHARAALLALRPTDFGVCIYHACALLACIEHFVSCLRAGGTDVTPRCAFSPASPTSQDPLRNVKHPPKGVHATIEAVCVLLGEQPDWKTGVVKFVLDP